MNESSVMTLAFDAKRAAQNRTGLGNYSRFVLEGLCTSFPDRTYQLYVPSREKARLLGSLEGKNCVELDFPEGSVWQKFPSLWRVFGMSRQIARRVPQLFHGLSNELPVGIERIPGLRTVVTLHDLIFMRYPEFYPRIDRKIYEYKFRSACRRADCVVAVSECTKRDLISFFGVEEEKIQVLYQGCDEQFRQLASSAQKYEVRSKYRLPERFLLYVGSIESRKNLLRLVEALAGMRYNLPLVAVGKRTSYADKVLYRARELGVANRLLMLHNVAFSDLPALYQMAEVFLYPSYFEGFGIPILEALCSRTPVVAATGSCLEEAGGPHSIYVSPSEAREWSVAIDQVLNYAPLRKEMTERGFEYAARFRSEHLARQMMTLYENICNK
ncbi:MAG: glycosyltransferase family 4 protein [Bacteroidaceae bacterium]|jgi:glycosyltransferase involved in cell wall biosynthesis